MAKMCLYNATQSTVFSDFVKEMVIAAENDSNAQGIFVFPDGRMAPRSAANYLGLAVKTLAIWRSRGIGPPFCKLSGRVFYFKAVVDNWVAERSDLVSSTQARTKAEMREWERNGALGLNHSA
jgi:hypothetical protein